MVKVASITKKHYYTIRIDVDGDHSFSFDIDDDMKPLDEGDLMIIRSMKCEDAKLTERLFDEIYKQINEGIPD